MPMMLAAQATGSGIVKLRGGNMRRPRMQLMATGMPYDTPSATTDAAVMALNAELEPRKMQPKMMTHAVLKMRALSGRSSYW